MNEYCEALRQAGVERFVVSVDAPAVSEALCQRLAVPCTFLSDDAGALLDKIGIRHVGGQRIARTSCTIRPSRRGA